MTDHALLGELSVEDFLTHYWQQQPLVIRNALPDFEPPVNGDDLAGLSLEDIVESRLITEQQNTGGPSEWLLESGPFKHNTFNKLPATHWTLLVQAVDLWIPEAKALLDRFDFLPAWRRDDLMMSFAAPQGSVGPHFDNYDVFLLQAEGRRRWTTGQQCDAQTALSDNAALRILANFEAQESWVLEAGDMLYLPPGIAHWGVAETAGLTYSIGFRAPRLADLLDEVVLQLLEDETFYTDPTGSTTGTDDLTPAVADHARTMLQQLIGREGVVEDALARLVTQPKYPDLLAETGESRTIWVGNTRFINGEPAND